MGRELDMQIATEVMGLKVVMHPVIVGWALNADLEGVETADEPCYWNGPVLTAVPHYSSDMNAAMQVVEKLDLLSGGYVLAKGNPWSKFGDNDLWCVLNPGHYGDSGSADVIAEAPTAAEAICLAALAVVKSNNSY